MKLEIEYLKGLANNGGPSESQYVELGTLFKSINFRRKKGILSDSDIQKAWYELSDVFYTTDTMQGYAVLKPHGYAGDFIIIERIYSGWLSPKSHLVKWDHFFHAQEAPRAILNRKKYFLDILRSLRARDKKCNVLNIGCGPAQDVVEFLLEEKTQIFFECVDYDRNAIEYSFNKVQEKGLLSNVEFHRDNAFRFRPSKQFDLIWSSGLFDYLDDQNFKKLLMKQLAFVRAGGELIVGNFSLDNPTRDYMEFGNWFLHHRSPDDLIIMASECGVPREKIAVKSEPLGVNLFLHIIQ
ncbi:MAG: class I SAM-dependent methyltransferase [Smithella sp.]|jgi:hypothetical protein